MDEREIKLNINTITDDSIVDGPGMRYTIFVQGCPHGCRGCHNPQTHAFVEMHLTGIDELIEDISENPLLSGVTFSGGEPFCQARVLAELGEKIKAMGLDIVCYTGYIYEKLRQGDDMDAKRLLDVIDILVDGPYIEELRDLELTFRGSSNQRIIDLGAMRAKGNLEEIIWWKE